MKRTSAPSGASTVGLRTALFVFMAALMVLLHRVFLPGETLFSNDGPLSQLMAQCHRLPSRFAGCWLDLGGVGLNGGAALPGISFGLQWLLGPTWFSKLYAIVSLLLLGIGAWYFFRQSRLTPVACVLGGLTAILNSTFFSVACWGMSPHVLAAAMSFLALGALADRSPKGRWLRVILAGFAIGMGVSEGADVGAIFSVYVGAFIVYQAWIEEGSRPKNLATGLGRLALVVICAAILASEAISGLINTSIKGIAGTQQNVQTRAERWNWATQWSLPKTESLSLVVPGLFGYRMDTPDGGSYWGTIGRDQSWNKYVANGRQGRPPTGYVRYTGSGYYEGIIVMLVALWAATQSFRRREPVFTSDQRKWLWFWTGISVLSFLLALGRFGPVYRWVYMLPYFSTIRNPVKFLYLFSFAVVVLFAFGLDALQRKYMLPTGPTLPTRWPGLLSWWKKAARFERSWIYGSAVVGIASMVGGLIYANQRIKLEDYLQSTQVQGDLDAIFNFSIHRVVFFLVFFLLSVGFMTLIFSGAFAGKRARTGAFLFGLLIVADLGVANLPWIVYSNYSDKFASNPIIDFLRNQPYANRVAIVPAHLRPDEDVLRQLYRIEWLQHQFPFYNIQSYDFADMPRMPEDLAAFTGMIRDPETNEPFANLNRAWQLSNTRYILAPMSFAAFWDRQNYLARTPLQTVARFEIVPREGVIQPTSVAQVTAATSPNGRFALFELPSALPRAKLYQQWQINTNNEAALKQLFDPDFDPDKTVLVDSGTLSVSATTQATNASPGTVQYASYAPKDILLKAEATAPSILLLNDHFDPNWKVLVDGQPAELLRCNYLMRGVQLAPGAHLVEFKFRPRFTLLYVSLSAIIVGFMMLGFLLVSANKDSLPQQGSTPPPAPASRPAAKPVPQSSAKPDPRKNGRNGKK